jgi:hypothetical protein
MTQIATDREDGTATELVEMLQSHEGREGSILGEYVRLAESCDDNGVRFLVRMLLEEESRHHMELSAMLNNLETFASGKPIGPRLPTSAGPIDDAAMLEKLHELTDLERSDAKELAELQHALESAQMPAFFGLLIELMKHDTAKHVAILEFISGIS